MISKKNIFIINGSAGSNSSNEKLIGNFVRFTKEIFSCIIFNDLKLLPHFDPGLATDNVPKEGENYRD